MGVRRRVGSGLLALLACGCTPGKPADRVDAVNEAPAKPHTPVSAWPTAEPQTPAELAALAEHRTVISHGEAPREPLRFVPKVGVDERIGFRVIGQDQIVQDAVDLPPEGYVERTPAYYVNVLRVEQSGPEGASIVVQRVLQYAEYPKGTGPQEMLGVIPRIDQPPRRAKLGPLGSLQPEPRMSAVFMDTPRDLAFADHLVLEVPEQALGVGARWEFVGVRDGIVERHKYLKRVEIRARGHNTLRVWIGVVEVPSPQYEGSVLIVRGQGELDYRLDRIQPVGGSFRIEVEYEGSDDHVVPGKWGEWRVIEFEEVDDTELARHRARAEQLSAGVDASIRQAHEWAAAQQPR